MKNSFWGLIWQSFLEIQGLWIGFLGVCITLILSRFPFKTSIPLDLVIIIAFFSLLFLFTLLQAVNKAFRYNKKLKAELEQLKETNETIVNEIKRSRIPKIIRVQKDQDQGILCLLESSELFVTGIIVSFYYIDEDEYERFIGGGFVKNIQSDGKIQAVIDQPYEVYQEVLDKLANNDHNVLERTKVRISILKEFNQPLTE